MVQSHSSQSTRAAVINFLGLLIAGALLALAIFQNREELARVFTHRVDYRLFGVGVGLYLVAMFITFTRWYLLVRVQAIPLRWRDAVRLGFIGNFYNLAIPGAVGGDVIKAAYLGRMFPDRKPQAWASMILDRILGLLGLFLLAGLAGLVAWPGADAQVRTLIGFVWVAIGMILLGLTVAFSPGLYRPLNRLVARHPRLAAVVGRLEAIGMAYRARLGTVILMLGVAMSIHALFVLVFFVASMAIFDDLPTLAEHYLMVPLTLFTTAVPLPFGALGLSEQISGRLFTLVHHADGAVAMMAFRVVMYACGAISGAVYAANLRQVRTIRADIEP